MTIEYRKVLTNATVHTARFGYSRTSIGQDVEANTSQRCRSSFPAAPCWAPSTSADFRASARRPQRTSGSVRT